MPELDDSGIFLTGFPGFIARRLVTRLLAQRHNATYFFLVEDRFAFAAQKVCQGLEIDHPGFAGRWHIVVGDIRRTDLGIDPKSLEYLRRKVTEVWHLAALYDLAVSQSVAYAVNVTGTARVLDFCAGLSNLRRLLYVSTCYVAGLRQGRVYEDELDCGQDFKNHYESTKFWAELDVQARMTKIPTTIFRPAVVVGDSKTGETVKGDGPYFFIRLLTTLPRWLPSVQLGRAAAPFNVVPVDFVVEAMARLALDDKAIGHVYQLADPTPLEAREFLELTLDALQRPRTVGTIPLRGARFIMERTGLGRALGIPQQSLDYLSHHTVYDVSNVARELGEDLMCPRVVDYWPTLVRYACQNPRILSQSA